MKWEVLKRENEMCSGRIRVAINQVEAVSAIKASNLDWSNLDGLNSNLKVELRIIPLIRFGKQAICAFPDTVT